MITEARRPADRQLSVATDRPVVPLRLEHELGSISIWAPVRLEGRVVDMRLVSSTSTSGLPAVEAGDSDPSQLMSVLALGSDEDGRLGLLCRCALTGEAARMTRPLVAGGPPVALSVQRATDGTVLLRRTVGSVEIPPALHASNESMRLRSLIDEAPLGICIVSIDGFMLEVNRMMCELLGRPASDLIGRRLHDFAYAGDDIIRLDRDELLREGRTRMEKRFVTADGQIIWFRASARLITEDGEERVLSMIEDITEVVRARSELRHRSGSDPLTGLRNRQALRSYLRREAAASAGQGTSMAMIFLDLDRFNVVNDSLGHDTGDRLLIDVASRLEEALPEGAALFRVGGDEFAAVLIGSPAQASETAGWLQAAFAQPVRLGERDIMVNASFGVALVELDAAGVSRPDDVLMRNADTALSAAKAAGRGRIVVFDERMRRQVVARLDDEQDLRRAMRNGEMQIVLQPICSTETCATVELEALVRWHHPARGIVPPVDFLPTLEEMGLMDELGRRVLDLACRQLAVLRRRRPELRVAVNIGAAHLLGGTLVDDVGRALETHDLPASALTIEVTEQTLVHAHDEAGAFLDSLRSDGCRVALDDFGTGYSSLAYLRQLPVDVLKVDRVFTQGLGTRSNDGALFTAIIALGQGLGLETVVEGIETDAELAAAEAAGASYLQGYLLGRPVAVEDLFTAGTASRRQPPGFAPEPRRALPASVG